MHKRFYSKEELSFLKENIDKFGVYVCSQKLNRHPNGVKTKCYREFGHCVELCHATQEEIDKLTFNDNFNPLIMDFSLTKFPKELAYFIGYFWADGYVSSKYGLFMEIVKNDADDIEHILNKICSFQTYERIRPNKQPVKIFHYCDYESNIKPLFEKLGKYPNSIESHKNILKYIPKEYIKYFLRGIFDGDGSLYIPNETSKCKSVQLVLSGRYEQDWSYLVYYLKENYNIEFKIIQNCSKNQKRSDIRNTNRNFIIQFMKKIYDNDDNIYLTRKYDKFKRLIIKYDTI